MKTLSIIAACLAVQIAQAKECQVERLLGGNDVVKNVGAGASIAGLMTLATNDPAIGVTTVAVLSGLKELSDRKRTNHRCSLADFTWGMAGAVAGAYGVKWIILPSNNHGVSVVYLTEF